MSYALGFIGCGNMAQALLHGLMNRQADIGAVYCCDILTERADALAERYRATALSGEELQARSDYLVLAIKPQQCVAVLKALAAQPLAGKKVISLVAGLSCATMEQILGAVPVVRAMPNTPALQGQGMSGLCAGRYASEEDMAFARRLFDAAGRTVIIDEAMMDACTAVSGSGPAYFFFIAEAMIDAAVRMGFAAAQAHELVLQVMKGSLSMLENSADSPAQLRAKVSSPGGTTLAALEVLERFELRTAFIEAIAAAARRSQEIEAGLRTSAGQ